MPDKPELNAKDFLENVFEMKMQTTQLLSVIDGVLKAPDLCFLMEEYHLAKLKELKQN